MGKKSVPCLFLSFPKRNHYLRWAPLCFLCLSRLFRRSSRFVLLSGFPAYYLCIHLMCPLFYIPLIPKDENQYYYSKKGGVQFPRTLSFSKGVEERSFCA